MVHRTRLDCFSTWFVLLHRAHIIEQCAGIDFLQGFPKTKQWQTELLKVDALIRSAPEGFVSEFANLYLNENTYLGSLMKSKGGHCGCAENAACDGETLSACCS